MANRDLRVEANGLWAPTCRENGRSAEALAPAVQLSEIATAVSATAVSATAVSADALRGLSDQQLLDRLAALVTRDHALTVEILLHLGEVEARGLHHARGCSSLFTYCVERLGFSEEVAYKRVGASRLVRQFPLALELLAQGQLHLTALMLLRPQLSEGNHRDLLAAACHKTKREVELLVATRCPRPDVPSAIRRLAERRRGVRSGHVDGVHLTGARVVHLADARGDCAAAAQMRGRAEAGAIPRVEPLSGSSYRVVFTASHGLKQKLDRAAELLSHSVVPGDLPALIERAVDLLIEHEAKRRFAASWQRTNSERSITTARHKDSGRQDPDPARAWKRRHRKSRWPVATTSRYVPAEVRRRIWERDGGQCAFVDSEGNRCKERRFLQIEHCKPHACGGPSTVDNCCLLCAGHNRYRAKQEFGEEHIRSARTRTPRRRT